MNKRELNEKFASSFPGRISIFIHFILLLFYFYFGGASLIANDFITIVSSVSKK